MSNLEFTSLEREMLSVNLDQLSSTAETAKSNIAKAKTAADVKTEICKVWNQVGKFVRLAAVLPVVGKYIKILADVLDSLCA